MSEASLLKTIARLRANTVDRKMYEKARDELTEARAAIAKLREALEELDDYFDNRADAEYGPLGTPVPNEEMRLLTTARHALAATPSDCYAQIRAEVLEDIREDLRKAERGDALQVLANYRAIRTRVLKDKP